MIMHKYKNKELNKKLIHPKERILFKLVTFITILGGIISLSLPFWASDLFEEPSRVWEISGFVILSWFTIVYFLGKQYASTRANAIKITKTQFPEVYDIIEDYSRKLEFKKVPNAYVIQEGGVLNAFAASFFKTNFIQINIDIFEVAYREHKDLNSLAFVIAHEMAHIKMRHTKISYNYLTSLGNLIPLLGQALSRAREYTCDQHALYLCPEGKEGLILLSAGKHLYKKIDMETYIQEAQEQKGFFIWLVNSLSSHPVMIKRMKALIDEKPGKLF
ncbi:M48 family metallopeptidase [Oceanirhabdus sp. W0125-5]|uniref:M48 family metallopeptidase n=1 Tax=Oceanirhabdus sp. W0125-5 TaxID=2999116 RepID=UPI0022F2DA95|nr:M48 family metallopeptidase [Oceanirhabdus sp. W0125-5]WBW95573.1 M48 family metallopeptidase [Oceanirhabdus sp. W0125-5]